MKTLAKSIKAIIITGVMAAALITAGIIYYFHSPSGMIAIDVNPSLEIHTNRLGEVVSIDPVNDDAKQLMAGYQLTSKNLETVIRDIVDRMILNGYLVNSDTDQILVSSDKSTNSDELLNKVTASFNSYLQEKQLAVQVLDQKVDMNREDIESAHENEVSVGKMAIINKIMENSSDLTVNDLAHVSVKHLIQYAAQNNISLSELIRNYSTALTNLTVSPTAAATPTPAGITEATPTPAGVTEATPTPVDDSTAVANTITISTGKADTNNDSDMEDANDQGDDNQDADIENKSENSDIKDSNEAKHLTSGKEDSEENNSDSDREGSSKKTSVKKTANTDAVSGATVNVSKEDSSDSNDDYDYEDSNDDSNLQENDDQGNQVQDRENQDNDRHGDEDSNNNWQDDQGEND